MKVFRGVSELNIAYNNVVTTGTFDGVHLGHQHVIDYLVSAAKKNKGESTIVTFFPHPRIVLQQNTDLKLLNELEEKIVLLEKTGVDNLVILPFTKDFSRLSSLSFVRDILVNKLNTKQLVIGYDHHFGRNREGSFAHLSEYGPLYGFEVNEIPVKNVDEVNISSTKIRVALEAGKVKEAKKYLGYRYFLSGSVVHGKQIGKDLGFPTANIKVAGTYKLIPMNGVYAVYVELSGVRYKGMLNIGVRPTFEDKKTTTVEVHIFDFDSDIYGHEISIIFEERVRAEKAFDDARSLINQLKRDRVNSIKLLR